MCTDEFGERFTLRFVEAQVVILFLLGPVAKNVVLQHDSVVAGSVDDVVGELVIHLTDFKLRLSSVVFAQFSGVVEEVNLVGVSDHVGEGARNGDREQHGGRELVHNT